MAFATHLSILAEDEGHKTARKTAETILTALETLIECGSVEERKSAAFLAQQVQDALAGIKGPKA